MSTSWKQSLTQTTSSNEGECTRKILGGSQKSKGLPESGSHLFKSSTRRERCSSPRRFFSNLPGLGYLSIPWYNHYGQMYRLLPEKRVEKNGKIRPWEESSLWHPIKGYQNWWRTTSQGSAKKASKLIKGI